MKSQHVDQHNSEHTVKVLRNKFHSFCHWASQINWINPAFSSLSRSYFGRTYGYGLSRKTNLFRSQPRAHFDRRYGSYYHPVTNKNTNTVNQNVH